MQNNTTKQLTYGALMAALVFITTRIGFPLSFNGGYIHIGDGFVLLCGVLLGPLVGGLAAAIGSALADILSGYAHWAFPTFIIKFLMAFIVGILIRYKDNTKLTRIIGISYSILWIAFILPLRFILDRSVKADTTLFLQNLESERITTTSYLLQLNDIYTIIFSFVALLIPALIVTFFILHSKGKLNFKPVEGMSFIIAGTIMIILYYISASIMYSTYIYPILDIIPNLIQFAVGIVIVNILYPLNKYVNL